MADFLAGLGRLETEAKAATTLASPMDNYLADSGQLFIDLMIAKIIENQSYVKGDLAQGLKAIPSVDSGGHKVEFFGDQEYTEWRNDGVSGTQQPRDTPFSFKSEKPHPNMVTNMFDWLNNNKKGVPASVNPYAVSVNVLKFGFDGIRFKEAAFSQPNLDSFENALLSLVAANATGKIERIIPQFK